MTRARILVVDDEPQMCEMLELGLAHHEFDVRSVNDGRSALDVVRAWTPDLIVLDVMMPQVDGIALVPMLRRQTEVPILMLSARGERDDKVAALNAGADDYVAKPFDLVELVARVRSCLRRPALAQRDTVEYAGITIDVPKRTVLRDGQFVPLTTREFDLLVTLLREPGRVFTRDQLIDRVWGYDAAVEPNVVETYVSYLRGKIDRNPYPKIIKTVRRVGYTARLG